MENKSEIEESKAFATGLFQGAQIVSFYMKDRCPLIRGVIIKSETGHRETCLKGLWMRAYAWMQTLEKLNSPLDFQAVSVANRALLEIAVDLVLLHHDKTNESGWRMFWWSLSEKLKASEQIVNFYTEQGLAVPDTYEAQETFYRDEKSIVESMRITLWPNKKNPSKAVHPDRWTGNSNLFPDIEKADELYGSVIKADIGSTLVEYYRTEYRKMNWRIHSGVAGFWNQPPASFNLVCGFALKCCADLGMLCTKIVLADFGFDETLEGLKQEWENIKRKRDFHYIEEMYKFHAGG